MDSQTFLQKYYIRWTLINQLNKQTNKQKDTALCFYFICFFETDDGVEQSATAANYLVENSTNSCGNSPLFAPLY